MRRRAILIGAPGRVNSGKFLKGVNLDIKNYIKFLFSPSGGVTCTIHLNLSLYQG